MNDAWRRENPWAITLAEARDTRLVACPPIEPGKLTQLKVWTVTHLRPVAARGIDVEALVQMTGRAGAERTLRCGDRDGAQFVRRDGLSCHFLINLLETPTGLQLLSYAFHVDAPGSTPAFLRWEYAVSRKAGVDAVKEPLAHLHPGHDDVRLPAPVLGPREIIAVFLGLERWG
jgi:hypothetical protein